MANPYHTGFGGIHRTPDQRFPRDGQQRRPALYPASRWARRLSQGARRQDDRLCRFHRQPPIHHARQSVRQSEGLSLSDRLRSPATRQDLRRSARRRRRSGSDRQADAGGLWGAARTSVPLHHLGLGRKLSAAYPATLRGRGRRRGCWPSATNASRPWRWRWNCCVHEAPASTTDRLVSSDTSISDPTGSGRSSCSLCC